ncbi:Starch-binding associating with outer membrane [Catalinimonas alkaloidigena]|uniref:Starch-binding associating with outer membrane n=1 Tax=Catalinimonas alkaloidigena TaxID=1075417 RepID=A0A1G8WYR9_9BACT|nr:RagB/SusD family nutrient uptake outer membrane protein [Catalinimonas alkaloidigena]SDJ83532.1 Starch-binding associating with outer membrane [Catalinimonas alkaloidigena]
MKLKTISLFSAALLILAACSEDFLEYEPKGVLSSENVAVPENIEGLVTAAYAGIANDEMIGPITSSWVYGSVRSDDAYKAGGGISDVIDINYLEQYNLVQPQTGDNWMGPLTFSNHYKAISRTNFALKALQETEDFDLKATRTGELRFLRGHSYFMLKQLFKYIPYIDETKSPEEILQTSNREYTNDELWNKIADDFQFAIDNLPATQPEVGRANQLAAKAYLAKVRLYQAYEQNESHQVVNINAARLEEVVSLTSDVIDAGRYSLQGDFAENFLDGYDNGTESVFAAQFSIADGTTTGRVSFVTGLNSPHGAPEYGCCGFHYASQNMVNAFKTSEAGLPMFDTFNDEDMLAPSDFLANGVDPRLDHTVGVPGHPYKYNPEFVYSESWARDPGVYGFFGNMKEQQLPDCACYLKQGPFIGTSKNIDFIRYADVLLMKAEALIELGRHAEALPLINQVRERAKASTERLQKADGSNPSNYRIETYVPGSNIDWTQENARKALQWERRLEFAMESPRFFDLVRWGIAEPTLNAYLAEEKTKRDYLSNAHFTAGRDEYLPIPQREIDFTKGRYEQNPGY